MKIFVLAERAKAARELCAGARLTGDSVQLVAVTPDVALTGVADTVFSIAVPESSMLEDALDTVASLVASEQPDMLFVEPTRRMKLLVGRLAARLKTSAVTDVLSIGEAGEASAMFFGGIAHRRVKSAGALTVMFVGPGVFADAVPSGTDQVATVEFVAPGTAITRTGVAAVEKSGVDLTAAKRVVGVGRGIAAEEDLDMIRAFAKAVDAEVGCTRPLTETEHWLPREIYIGVSGVMLAPDVYFAIGISGQVQHTVGIDRAKTIIAINKDKNAPIFDHADYGLVADLYKVVPKMTEQLA